jgi:1,4-dihydroxy-6-naphthoate synthase
MTETRSNILTLAYSPCPNDTYIFYALAHQKIATTGLKFNIALHDVEYLNQAAKENRYQISKLSFAAIGHLLDSYVLLNAGAALGRGCGPLFVARKGIDLSRLLKSRVAVPGLWTTAYLLLSLFTPNPPDIMPMQFDQIMPAIQAGEYDGGVIIHEGRFTYENYGLTCLVDLGEWWEAQTSLPIPLGGIAIRRDIPKENALQVESAILKSIQYANQHPHETDLYIRSHAQEMDDDVINRHIGLYVNEFSMDLGEIGIRAIETLFSMARTKRMMPDVDQNIFLRSNF